MSNGLDAFSIAMSDSQKEQQDALIAASKKQQQALIERRIVAMLAQVEDDITHTLGKAIAAMPDEMAAAPISLLQEPMLHSCVREDLQAVFGGTEQASPKGMYAVIQKDGSLTERVLSDSERKMYFSTNFVDRSKLESNIGKVKCFMIESDRKGVCNIFKTSSYREKLGDLFAKRSALLEMNEVAKSKDSNENKIEKEKVLYEKHDGLMSRGTGKLKSMWYDFKYWFKALFSSYQKEKEQVSAKDLSANLFGKEQVSLFGPSFRTSRKADLQEALMHVTANAAAGA
jgi:hypothetical protein